MSKKDNTPEEHAELNQFIPRPESGPARRHMVACEPEAYEFISDLADKLKTNRNRIVTALVEYYKTGEQ